MVTWTMNIMGFMAVFKLPFISVISSSRDSRKRSLCCWPVLKKQIKAVSFEGVYDGETRPRIVFQRTDEGTSITHERVIDSHCGLLDGVRSRDLPDIRVQLNDMNIPERVDDHS